MRSIRLINKAAVMCVALVCLSSSAQEPAATPNWKDRQEYDLFLKMSQTADAKARLDLLNTWQDKYPQSEVAALRLKYYIATLAVLAEENPGDRQLLLDKCEDLLKQDSNDANALYEVALWGPVLGGSKPTPELLTAVESAANGFIAAAGAAFAPANKPANISIADFAKAKSFRLGVAHNALAWEARIKANPEKAEAEYKASLTANPEQGTTAAQYARLLYEQKRYAEALFEYACAAQYTGPGPAITPAERSQLMDFFAKMYKNFHGSMDGAEQVLAEAKTNALPPAGFAIASTEDVVKKEADDLAKRIASDPGFGLWYTIRQNLTSDQGDAFFEKTVKDALIPGGAQGVRAFSGTVISLDAEGKNTKVLVGVDDSTKADATLEFSKPLSSGVLEKLKSGQKIEFSGVVTGYVKDPYMLIFKDPVLSLK